MHSTSITSVCFLAILSLSSSAPISFRIRQLISPSAPPTGVRVQTPHDIAVIDAMGFHNPGDSGTQNATCIASDVACVAKRAAQKAFNNIAARDAAPTKKRTRRTKRTPQGNPGAAAAQAFADGIDSVSIDASPQQNMSCLASDVACVAKRNAEVPKEEPQATKRTPQDYAAAAANFAASMDAPPTAPLNMSCLASDVECVAKRNALVGTSTVNTAAEAAPVLFGG